MLAGGRLAVRSVKMNKKWTEDSPKVLRTAKDAYATGCLEE